MATDSDGQVAATVRLLHRRRGWIWATVLSVAAWVLVAGLMGALAPNQSSGPGVAVGSIFVLLLTVVAIVGLVASIVDTVKLRGRGAGVRRQAVRRTAHYPVRAHPYSYPPRHRFSWVFGWIVLLFFLGLGVAMLPAMVDGVAYLAGAESTSTFTPASYGQDCGRSGCSTVTDGTLSNGASVTWMDQVPLGEPFQVRVPVMDWGFGSQLISGDGLAIVFIFLGVLFDGFSVFVLYALYKVARNWLRHRQLGRHLVGPDLHPTR